MSEIRAETASVVDRIRPIVLGGAVVAVHLFADTPVFALAEESVVFAPAADVPRVISVHSGAILAATADDNRSSLGAMTGVVTTDASAQSSPLTQNAAGSIGWRPA